MSEKKESFMEKVERENLERATTCKSCKRTTDKSAKVCPHCGKKDPTGQRKGKIGCLIMAILLLIPVIAFMLPDPEPELSEAAQKAIENSTIEREVWHQIKVTYKVTIPLDSLKKVKENEVENILKVILSKQNEKQDFERSFVVIYAPEMNSGFASLNYEKKGNKDNVTIDWRSVKGLDYLYKNKNIFYPQIRLLRSQLNKLSNEFLQAYKRSADLSKFIEESKKINEEWDIFMLKNTPKGFSINFPGSYGKVKNIAMIIMTSINDSKKYFLIKQFQKDLKSMNAYQL